MDTQVFNIMKELSDVKADIAHIKATLTAQENYSGEIEKRLDSISITLEKLSGEMFPRRDLDAMFNQYRGLEERVHVLEHAPTKRKVAFVDKMLAVIVAIIITSIVGVGVASVHRAYDRIEAMLQTSPVYTP